MIRPIGYYVHHHGQGHLQRALAIASHNPARVVLLGTGLSGRTGSIHAIDLPDDRMAARRGFDGVDNETSRPEALHYAPLNHNGVRERMGCVAQWITSEKPSLFVVDVSVEIALLARLCSTPVAFVRLSGQRDDRPHLEAYRAASVVLAPFSAQLDTALLPQWVRDKTVYCPGIISVPSRSPAPIKGTVLVVAGKGGTELDGRKIAAAATATPLCRWRVIGPIEAPAGSPENVVFAGWVDHPEDDIARSEIVVGGAGDGLVEAVIAMRKPFICMPEARPFDEQVAKARALEALKAATVCHHWPQAADWPGLLAEVAIRDRGALTALGDAGGGAKTMAMLDALANRQK